MNHYSLAREFQQEKCNKSQKKNNNNNNSSLLTLVLSAVLAYLLCYLNGTALSV